MSDTIDTAVPTAAGDSVCDPVPEELALLRRVAALSRCSQRITFLAAGLQVECGMSPEEAHRTFFGSRRRFPSQPSVPLRRKR
jgi:hypothetical protein